MALERFIVTKRSFIGGSVKEAGEIVALDTEHTKPGDNLREEFPKAVSAVVDPKAKGKPAS